MPVFFHRLAVAEYHHARHTYGRRSPAVAARFEAAVDTAVARIDANPAIGSPALGPYRWVKVRRFSYLLWYRELSPGQLLIYAVAHASRRPLAASREPAMTVTSPVRPHGPKQSDGSPVPGGEGVDSPRARRTVHANRR
jgi:plasmid stabilization system protein ParE